MAPLYERDLDQAGDSCDNVAEQPTGMPDQSSAATEHAILQEITAPLRTLPDDPVAAVHADFPVALRGYDRLAVDAYVQQTSQLVAELHATRSPEAAVRKALERVGEQISGILQRAHTTAEEITGQSRAEAEDRLEHARIEAAEIVTGAHQRVKDLDADTDRIWIERHRIVDDARELARQLTVLADAAAERFPAADASRGARRRSLLDTEDEAEVDSEAEAERDGSADDELEDAEQELEYVDDDAAATSAELAVTPDVRHPANRRRSASPKGRRNPAAVVVHPRRRSMRVIDLMHLGRERVIGCWQVGDVLIDPGPGSCLPVLLDALGDDQPRALLLTHIHLDHAGASGALVQRWPDLEVYVHERGARHMHDPSRLIDSARRLYGDDMDRLWGEMVPVPERNLTVLSGGERLLDGAFEVAYTPGHASHHVSYLHDGTAFVGDVGGVQIAPGSPSIPPTPPPDIDVEAWHESLELIRAWRPERLAMTHFGAAEDVDAQLAELEARLDEWAELARTAGDGRRHVRGRRPGSRRSCAMSGPSCSRRPTSRRLRPISCTRATGATGANGGRSLV